MQEPWRSFATILPRCALLLASLCFAAQAQAPLDVRIALVIGNSAYADAPLANPSNDANAVGEALKKMGFTVQQLRNTTKAEMTQALAALAARLKEQRGIALFYYAGHGVQVDYENYLVPVDARISQESDIASSSVGLGSLLDELSAASGRASMVVLDACRDNPFKARQSFAGLAPRDPRKGVVVAYATEPGNVAEDGDPAGGNGLYTRYLLKEMARPSATVDEVFKRVRFAVRRASKGRQIPSYANGLDRNFAFDRGFDVRAPDEPTRAKRFAAEKAHWDRIRQSTQADDYFDFIDAYPDSGIGEIAQAVLERIARRQLLTQANPGEAQQFPADSRFRKGDVYKMRSTIPGEPYRVFTARVTDVTAEVVKIADVFADGLNGEYTIAGATLDDGVSTYDPPFVLVPGGEYQVGKRWAGRTIRTYKPWYLGGVAETLDYAGRVVGRERISVPAGTFDTYRVDFSFQAKGGLLLHTSLWVQPEWGVAMKAQYQAQDARTGAVRTVVREVVERHRGGT